MRATIYTSAFCGPCAATRAVFDEVQRLVPALDVVERDVVAHEHAAEQEGVRSTPTVVITDDAGERVFRAEGAPTLQQALGAVARAVSTGAPDPAAAGSGR